MNPESSEYFMSEICAFRDLMGSKSFWAKSAEHRELALKAISILYLNFKSDNPREKEDVINIFIATTEEYTRRESMLMVRGLLGHGY